ncbi:hypothetical protein CONPUDRAFT_163696 [Coniophora puteana RWD-64-598 SS2]|uniref:Uncharacterized protein n=1 Tax=Coniophora puteana (strain RWD-64-598) TaxID=741705 RepID=A0A5M3MU74_CONPW|nr:uncharacterized protein CONPUDRAFT_163696 [Coniophora puteana RWD-64-598 SS2]EIW82557.1 hypothetical protein CONPUDRAFT_163696 [Coniophora puteana RWD-64-598 SS2]
MTAVMDTNSPPIPPKSPSSSQLMSPVEQLERLLSPGGRSTTGGSKSRIRNREHGEPLPTARDLARLLSLEERACQDLREQVLSLTEQLQGETRRADDAERRVVETVVRFKEAADARVAAQQEGATVREELELYKDALERAQKEIFRAQEVLNTLEGRARDAEEECARYRRRVRKMTEERMVEMAREEGRKQGIKEGMRLGLGKDILVHERSRRPPARTRDSGSSGTPTPTDSIAGDSIMSVPSPISPQQPMPASHPPPPAPEPVLNTLSSSSMEDLHRGRTATPSGGARTRSRSPLYSPRQSNGSNPQVNILDGFIPSIDADHHIRLPPPHELGRPPPSPESAAYTPLRPASPASSAGRTPPPNTGTPEHILYVPEPRSDDSRARQRRVGRRSSRESVGSSTKTSELELLNAPPEYAGQQQQQYQYTAPPPPSAAARAHAQRESGLSVIPEVQSSQGTPASGFGMNVAVDSPPNSQKAYQAYVTEQSDSSSGSLKVPQSSAGRMSASSYGSYNITVQPPSRPGSSISQKSANGHPNTLRRTPSQPSSMLSPADANRPTPLPNPYEAPELSPLPGNIPLNGLGSNDTMSAGEDSGPGLPLGFVPTGPPESGGQGGDETAHAVPVPPPATDGLGGGQAGPLPVPPQPAPYTPNGFSIYHNPDSPSRGEQPAVIPPPLRYAVSSEEDTSGSSGNSSPASPRSSSSSSSSSSGGGSPRRYKTGSVRSSRTRYTAAGVPLPSTPRTAYTAYTGAGVALPASTVGGATPRSVYTAAGVALPPSTVGVGAATPRTGVSGRRSAVGA